MKKWHLILFLFASCILMLISSCRKKGDPPVHYIPAEYKPYIDFLPGSYWIYEDSVSGALDSVIVDEYKNDLSPFYKRDYDEEATWYDEYISVVTYSFFTSQKHSLTTRNVCSHPSPGSSCCMTTRELGSSGESSYIHLAQYSFDLGSVNSGGDETVAIYPVYMIGTVAYETVVKTYIPSDFTEEGYHSYYYLAKDAGIIRKEVQTAWGSWHIWKLLRYYVVR